MARKLTTAEYSAVRKFAWQTSNGSALAETISKESIFSDLNNLLLEETVKSALQQIEERKYDTELLRSGVKKENIRHYGFAFEGKKF